MNERQKLAVKARLALLPPDVRMELIGVMRVERVPAELVSFAEGVHGQLLQVEKQRTQTRQMSEIPAQQISPEQMTAAWKSVKQIGVFVSVVSGGVAVFAYAVIPAMVAVGTALVTIAPYAVGGAFALVVLREILAGIFRKKTEQVQPAEQVRVRTTTITEVF